MKKIAGPHTSYEARRLDTPSDPENSGWQLVVFEADYNKEGGREVSYDACLEAAVLATDGKMTNVVIVKVEVEYCKPSKQEIRDLIKKHNADPFTNPVNMAE